MAASEEQLRAYLLNELAEADRFLVESRLLAEESFFEECAAVEDELIEAYLRGDLSRDRRARFERDFLASPRRRERLEFMRSLVAVLPEPATTSFLHRLKDWFQPLGRPAYAGFAMAVLVILAFGIWLLWPAPLVVPPPGVVKNDPPPVTPPSNDPKPSPKIEEPVKPDPTPEKPSVFAVVLGPTARGGGNGSRLKIPANIRTVSFRLDLDPQTEAKRVDIEVSTAEGTIIFSGKNRPVRGAGQGKNVVFRIPSGKLKRNDYLIVLSARSSSGESQGAGTFSFGVQ